MSDLVSDVAARKERIQIALASGAARHRCPHCRHMPLWEIPRNGIGVLCGVCGAWCLINPDRRSEGGSR